MRAMCARGSDWKVFGECDICRVVLTRRFRNIPGTGSVREMGLFCPEHGIMLPEHVMKRQADTQWVVDQ